MQTNQLGSYLSRYRSLLNASLGRATVIN